MINRRQFLNESLHSAVGLILGAVALPLVPQRVFGANDKIVLALIGAGGRGTNLIQNITKLEKVETKYICEVDNNRGGNAINEVEKIQGYAPKRIVDMRKVFDDKDINAVIIATPEHWHALASIWACQAGKDVYVEKNISLSIWEGRKMIEAARKYKRILQAGTQNRSAPYALSAREYIRSGKLGKVVHVKVFNMLGEKRWQKQKDSKVPEGLDWELWLGPAPKVKYNVGRHRGWISYYDYAGGVLAGDGSHQLDLARMIIGDPPHPKSVYCAGGRLTKKDGRETPDMQAITYDYGDFTMTIENTTFPPYMKKSSGNVRYGEKFPYWPQNATRIEIYGTKQLMYVGRHGGGWQVVESDGKVVSQEYGYFPDKWHQKNFIESIRTREKSNSDVEQSHMSATLVHMGNLSYRVGNKQLILDAKKEIFLNSIDANKLLKPNYRKHYRVPNQV